MTVEDTNAPALRAARVRDEELFGSVRDALRQPVDGLSGRPIPTLAGARIDPLFQTGRGDHPVSPANRATVTTQRSASTTLRKTPAAGSAKYSQEYSAELRKLRMSDPKAFTRHLDRMTGLRKAGYSVNALEEIRKVNRRA